MKAIVALLALTGWTVACSDSVARTWTLKSGKTVEARWTSLSGSRLHLEFADSQELPFKTSRISSPFAPNAPVRPTALVEMDEFSDVDRKFVRGQTYSALNAKDAAGKDQPEWLRILPQGNKSFEVTFPIPPNATYSPPILGEKPKDRTLEANRANHFNAHHGEHFLSVSWRTGPGLKATSRENADRLFTSGASAAGEILAGSVAACDGGFCGIYEARETTTTFEGKKETRRTKLKMYLLKETYIMGFVAAPEEKFDDGIANQFADGFRLTKRNDAE